MNANGPLGHSNSFPMSTLSPTIGPAGAHTSTITTTQEISPAPPSQHQASRPSGTSTLDNSQNPTATPSPSVNNPLRAGQNYSLLNAIAQALKRSPHRLWSTIRSFDRTTVVVGLILATIAVVPAYQSWRLGRWTALKDYIEYCKQNLVSSKPVGHCWAMLTPLKSALEGNKRRDCELSIKQGLGPPPYLGLSNRIRAVKHLVPRRAYIFDGMHHPFDLHEREAISSRMRHQPDSDQLVAKTLEDWWKSIGFLSGLALCFLWLINIFVYYFFIRLAIRALVKWANDRHALSKKLMNEWVDLRPHFLPMWAWAAIFSCSLLISAVFPLLVFHNLEHLLQLNKDQALEDYLRYCTGVQVS
jgi:hypothetical protein